jgi:hypothetical protein
MQTRHTLVQNKPWAHHHLPPSDPYTHQELSLTLAPPPQRSTTHTPLNLSTHQKYLGTLTHVLPRILLASKIHLDANKLFTHETSIIALWKLLLLLGPILLQPSQPSDYPTSMRLSSSDSTPFIREGLNYFIWEPWPSPNTHKKPVHPIHHQQWPLSSSPKSNWLR